MKRIIFSLLAVSTPTLADQPPDWQDFVVQSENREWSAVVQRKRTAEDPWEDEWELKVYNGFYKSPPSPKTEPSWSRSYDASGYSSGYLSNDGSAFTYVEFWYYPDRPVVQIYRPECTIQRNGSFFEVGQDLDKTASHELWLEHGDHMEYYTYEDDLYLKLKTVKGARKVKASCE